MQLLFVHVCCYIQSAIGRMSWAELSTANCTQNKLYFPEDASGERLVCLFVFYRIFVYYNVKQDQFLLSLWWSIQLCCAINCSPFIDTLYLAHSHTNNQTEAGKHAYHGREKTPRFACNRLDKWPNQFWNPNHIRAVFNLLCSFLIMT